MEATSLDGTMKKNVFNARVSALARGQNVLQSLEAVLLLRHYEFNFGTRRFASWSTSETILSE